MNSCYRESIKLAITSFFMFLLFIGISFYPLIIPDKLVLINSGLALPILYMIEFSLIIPLYFILFRKHDEMNIGKGSFKMFFTFLILLILTQFAGSYIMDIRKPESWMIEQDAEKGNLFLLNLLLLIFIVPVYEELIFRGCLLRTMLISFRGNVYLSSLATSIVFSVLHTQYNDIRTFVILFLVSLILIGARIASNGMVMPILLHMTMNGIILGVIHYFLIG